MLSYISIEAKLRLISNLVIALRWSCFKMFGRVGQWPLVLTDDAAKYLTFCDCCFTASILFIDTDLRSAARLRIWTIGIFDAFCRFSVLRCSCCNVNSVMIML
jgi:hypothetical protein